MSDRCKFCEGNGWKPSTGAALRAYALEKLMDIGFAAGMPAIFLL